ncbi:hypothetical protein V8F33_005204 [Rhypophila sp. PSN 637]
MAVDAWKERLSKPQLAVGCWRLGWPVLVATVHGAHILSYIAQGALGVYVVQRQWHAVLLFICPGAAAATDSISILFVYRPMCSGTLHGLFILSHSAGTRECLSRDERIRNIRSRSSWGVNRVMVTAVKSVAESGVVEGTEFHTSLTGHEGGKGTATTYSNCIGWRSIISSSHHLMTGGW